MKQYLMICNEVGMDMLKNVFKHDCVQFLEIQGMALQGNGFNILVTPILPPVNPMVVPQQILQEQQHQPSETSTRQVEAQTT